MRTRLLLVLSMVGILLAAVACSGAPKDVQLEVTIDELTNDKHVTRQVEVGDGGTLTVTLGSNPTTGFEWTEQAEIGDQTVLQQTGHKFTGPEEKDGTPPPPGTAGKEEWTFNALKKGETKVHMEYSRPWEGGEKGEWTFDLTVVVK